MNNASHEAAILGGLSSCARRTIRRAYKRPERTICPTGGVGGAAQTALLKSLASKGLITADGCPVLTPLGERIAAEEALAGA